jgi:hypothetical protein
MTALDGCQTTGPVSARARGERLRGTWLVRRPGLLPSALDSTRTVKANTPSLDGL